jgi:hypothetical protein
MRHFLVSVTSTVTKKANWMAKFEVRETSSFKVRSEKITLSGVLAQAKNLGLVDPEIIGWTQLPIEDSHGQVPTV